MTDELAKLLREMMDATYVPNGVDALARMTPLHWHYCDIHVRINGEWRIFEGDWLKSLFKVRETARAYLSQHEQRTAEPVAWRHRWKTGSPRDREWQMWTYSNEPVPDNPQLEIQALTICEERTAAQQELGGITSPECSPKVASLADAVAPIPKPAVKLTSKGIRPDDYAMIEVLALHYRVHESTIITWLLAMDLDAASKRMAQEFAA